MKGFDGTYYKHQKGQETVAVIAGTASNSAFIQVITNTDSYYFSYPLSSYKRGKTTMIGDNVFSSEGIKLRLTKNGSAIFGEIRYICPTPLRYDIMGPFKCLPVQCRHKIVSLHHRLAGILTICGKTVDFTDGLGYIEGDRGTSFPESYCWLQCNDFPDKTCITVSVADVPFLWSHFRGCICVVYLGGVEYRLATYLGAKILCCDEKRIVLKQGKLCFEAEIEKGSGHTLLAPKSGRMSREIRERIVCRARFRFTKNGEVLLDRCSENASFEFTE